MITASRPATCKGCGALMLWAVAPSGAALPLDATLVMSPANDARVTTRVVLYRLEDGRAVPVKADAAEPGVPLFLSHFATCPVAAQFSRATTRRRS